ncbi:MULTISPECIES: hypothetical protein [unclassified Microcoleus]|uniref:hypothetical protein n=1 Tax=unclassified Microcoleus TaxID=2642155 RepID=UPI002FD52F2E
MEDNTIAYQRKMDGEYFAANFKRVFFPADPFETGVLVDAANLDVSDLVAIYRATKNLEAGGHQAFVNTLILSRDNAHLTPMVRVNPLFVDRRRQQKVEVCELLQDFFYGDCQTFKTKRQEIIDMGDAQLLEFVQQVEEVLGLTPREMKVMEVIDED